MASTGAPYSVGGTRTGGTPSRSGYSANSSKTAFGNTDSTVKSNETNTSKDKTTTKNKGDVTTTNVNVADTGAQTNLLANAKGSIDSLIAAQQGAYDLYNKNIANNQAVANQQTLENNRNANNNWYLNQQKLQNVSSALAADLGQGNYGSGRDTLAYLTGVYDDMQDQQLLNNQRQQQNEIYQDLFSANANATNDFNESLLSNKQELMDQVYAYLTDYNQFVGNTTTQRNKTNEKTITNTKGSTKTKTKTKSNNSNNTQGNTITSSVNSTNNVKNNTTGNNTVKTTVKTNLSSYLDDNGNIDYAKVGKALGLGTDLTAAGTSRLGRFQNAPKLQQQNNYRTPRDTVAALTKRYGG